MKTYTRVDSCKIRFLSELNLESFKAQSSAAEESNLYNYKEVMIILYFLIFQGVLLVPRVPTQV